MRNLEVVKKELLDILNSSEKKELLFKAEQEIMNNEECRKLIDIFQMAQDDYNFYLKSFGENHEYTKTAQKKLYEAKLNLDTNELIKNYNEIFKDINEPRRYLQDKLISLFARRGSCSC